MLDNGAFTGNFDFRRWVLQLALLMPWRSNCLGIVAPDKPFNAKETVKMFHKYYAVPMALGYKVAHATQDGMTPEMLPWHLFDVLFIGGSDAHKRGPEAEALARSAIENDKWIHVGRVSSASAIVTYWTWAHSFDGTTFIYDGEEGRADKMRRLAPQLANLGVGTQWRMM